MMFTSLLLSVVSIASFLYLLVTIGHGYWRRRNVPGPAPSFFGGNIGNVLRSKQALGAVYSDIYREYRNYPFVGIYNIFAPALLIRDLDIVKQIMIKDIANFRNNTIAFDENSVLLGKNPFMLTGQEWKTVRQQLTPLVSSSKVKSAMVIFNESAEKMVNYVKKATGPAGIVTLDAKNLSSRYTASNVASWGVGIDAKSFEDDPSDFYKLSLGLFQFSLLQNLLMFFAFVFPSIAAYFKISFLNASKEKKIADAIAEGVRYRKEHKIERNDFLSGLFALKESGAIRERDVVSHVGSLYIDGIETSAIIFHFVLYELAANPDAQEELKREIDEVLKRNNGAVTFDDMQEMKYLDAVFNETLRIQIGLAFLDKRAVDRYKLAGIANDGQRIEVTLEAGMSVIIPLQGLHMDEEYFPDPTAFKPERFLPENRDSIPKYCFMPFGEGPRACIGKIFSTAQVKIGVIYLVKNFRISLAEETPYPFVVDPSSFFSLPKDPIKLKFQRSE